MRVVCRRSDMASTPKTRSTPGASDACGLADLRGPSTCACDALLLSPLSRRRGHELFFFTGKDVQKGHERASRQGQSRRGRAPVIALSPLCSAARSQTGPPAHSWRPDASRHGQKEFCSDTTRVDHVCTTPRGAHLPAVDYPCSFRSSKASLQDSLAAGRSSCPASRLSCSTMKHVLASSRKPS